MRRVAALENGKTQSHIALATFTLLTQEQTMTGREGGRRRGGFKVNLAMRRCTRITVSTENWHKVGNESKRHKLKMWTRKMPCFFLFIFFFFSPSSLFYLVQQSRPPLLLPPIPLPLGKKKGELLLTSASFLLWVGKCFNTKSLKCRLLCSHTALCELCMAIQSRY